MVGKEQSWAALAVSPGGLSATGWGATLLQEFPSTAAYPKGSRKRTTHRNRPVRPFAFLGEMAMDQRKDAA